MTSCLAVFQDLGWCSEEDDRTYRNPRHYRLQ
jgi:hypothetical protein